MINDNTEIKVMNRVNGTVGYTIPDLNNLHRSFASGETKKVTMEELRKLSYIPGGDIILRDCLVIKDEEAVQELLGEVEPEYNYTEADIRELLANGTIEQFLDCLDYAPKGVIDLIKDLSVKTKLNDVAKRKAILDKTGFNVTNAIDAEETVEGLDDEAPKTERRAAPITTKTEPQETGRRTAAPGKYNIVSVAKK